MQEPFVAWKSQHVGCHEIGLQSVTECSVSPQFFTRFSSFIKFGNKTCSVSEISPSSLDYFIKKIMKHFKMTETCQLLLIGDCITSRSENVNSSSLRL